jgi:hypothetical protein
VKSIEMHQSSEAIEDGRLDGVYQDGDTSNLLPFPTATVAATAAATAAVTGAGADRAATLCGPLDSPPLALLDLLFGPRERCRKCQRGEAVPHVHEYPAARAPRADGAEGAAEGAAEAAARAA